jgi:hypothetical protein
MLFLGVHRMALLRAGFFDCGKDVAHQIVDICPGALSLANAAWTAPHPAVQTRLEG